MKHLVFTLLFALFSSVATAEFTDTEKAEMKELVNAKIDMQSALSALAFLIKAPTSPTDAQRQLIYNVLLPLENASFNCSIAFSHFVNDRYGTNGGSYATREEYLSVARTYTNSCRASLSSAQNAAGVLEAQLPSAADTYIANASAKMAGFDENLPYVNPYTAAFPAVVGPHGDVVKAIRYLSRSDLYYHQTYNDLIRLYQTVAVASPSFHQHVGEILNQFSGLFEAHIRTWAMDVNVILDDDMAIILADQAAGNNLRPFEFWRLNLQFEYLLANSAGKTPISNSGRQVKRGLPGYLQNMMVRVGALPEAIASVNTQAEYLRHLSGGGTTHGSGPDGRLQQFYQDIFDAWGDSDLVLIHWNGFFHHFPPPPNFVICAEPNVCVAPQ